MSGHSKWSTIKRKKAITDAKKGKEFSKISRMISIAIKEKGSSPDTNLSLRLALEKAKEANMPSENIQRIMKKWTGDDAVQLETLQFEGYGPHGVAIIADCITDSRNRTSQEMKHCFSKHNGSVATPGSVLWMFTRCGKIFISVETAGAPFFEEHAINAGAQDIRQEENGAIVITKPDELYQVKKYLEDNGITIERAEFDYEPKNVVVISDPEQKKQIEDLLEALDDNEDVQELYSNVEFAD